MSFISIKMPQKLVKNTQFTSFWNHINWIPAKKKKFQSKCNHKLVWSHQHDHSRLSVLMCYFFFSLINQQKLELNKYSFFQKMFDYLDLILTASYLLNSCPGCCKASRGDVPPDGSVYHHNGHGRTLPAPEATGRGLLWEGYAGCTQEKRCRRSGVCKP